MKLNSLSVLCLSLLLFYTRFSLARKIGGGGLGKGFGTKKFPTSNRGNTHTNTGHRTNQGTNSQGGYHRQPGQPNQGGYPAQAGGHGYPGNYPGSYPQQPGGGGYPNQRSPYGGGYGGYGGQGGYGGHGAYGGYGGHGGYGGYPGGHVNYNPNNQILSPRYGGSFGYGGNGAWGGSPFSRSVQSMGKFPSEKSKGFGRSAVMAAAGGAMAGMALGYGLGRFPRPHFHFHSPQEEYYYNHYMYHRYGVKSTDTNDYSRDYRYSPPPQTYDSYMDSCMKRTDLLPVEKKKPQSKPAATTTSTAAVDTSAPDSDTDTNPKQSNSTAAGNSSTSAPSLPPLPLNQPEANPVPPGSQIVQNTAAEDDDDDTVSIVEIGYPALIEQLKVRRCLELYMVYSDKYLKKQTNGAQGLMMGSHGLLAVFTTTVLMLLH